MTGRATLGGEGASEVVHVTIERLDVHLPAHGRAQPQPDRLARGRPAVTLGEYLRRRGQRRDDGGSR